jgi:class 3 adenylate cyclase
LSTANPEQVIEQGIAAIASIMQVDWASYTTNAKETWIYTHPQQLQLPQAEIWAQGQQNLEKSQIIIADHPTSPLQSSLLLPLRSEQQFLGVLGFYSCHRDFSWSEEFFRLGESLAAQISLILEQSAAYSKVRELAERETLVNKITSAIRSSLETEAIFAAITCELGQALQVDGCALSLWTKEDRFVRCVGLYDRYGIPKELPQSLVPIAQNPVLQELIHRAAPVILNDLNQQPQVNQFDLPFQSPATALLIVPLLLKQNLIGSISLRHIHQVRPWTESEVALVQTVAEQAAIAVQQSRLYHLSQYQAQQLQESEQRVKQLNQYLTESVLKRFLPAAIVNQVASGELSLDLSPEPRFITILFSDIVDFTHLANQLESTHLSLLLNEYLSAMTDTVFAFGGTVDKFIGDAILALFGAPENLRGEEQVKRAIAVARTMQQRLHQLNQDWLARGLVDGQRIPLIQFRGGIHQGAAIVGMFGGQQRSDYTAIGTAVNIAARLQEAAAPNQILVSEAVATHLEATDWQASFPLKLKGVEEELWVFSLSP